MNENLLLLCTKCKQRKPTSDFTRKNSKRGFHSWCKRCSADNMAERRGAGLQPYNPRQRKNYDLQRMYGIGIDEYEEMLTEQGNSCAICRREKCPSGYRLAVDHDHETGVVRGLLCVNCNQAIGKFYHDRNLLQAAIEYLAKAEQCEQ